MGYGTPTYGGAAYASTTPTESGVTLSAPTATINVDAIPGGISTALPAPTATINLATPTPDIQTEVRLAAPTATVALTTPTPEIETQITLDAPTATVTFETPTDRIGPAVWLLDNTGIERVTGETATNTTLSLTTRVTSTALEAELRPLKSDEGKVDVLGTDDGGFVAIDRADGNNTFTLIPPVRRQPLREQETVHVQRYEESLVSQDVGEWDVTAEVARDEDRTDTPSVNESPAADEWGFSTRYGEIATARVDADVIGTGESGVDRFRVTTRLTMDQSHVFEAALARLGAGRVRNIPDAPNVAVDDSTDDAVTVTVDAPDSQDTVADGDYIVTGWESSRLTDAYQSVEFTIASK